MENNKNKFGLGSFVTYAPCEVREIPFSGGRKSSSLHIVPNGTTGEGVVVHQWLTNPITGEGIRLVPVELARKIAGDCGEIVLPQLARRITS
jgi:hypothetical protein